MICNCLKDLTPKIENKGKELVLTLSGDETKLKVVEKKIKLLQELICDETCCKDSDCCC